MNNKILFICGPTAVGKTSLAFKLARKYGGDVIAADSRQVYRGMDIGTGKDIPHNASIIKTQLIYRGRNIKPYRAGSITIWGYDLVTPSTQFTVADYHQYVWIVLTHLISRRRLPIITGGTGLYLNSIFNLPDTAGIPPNFRFRKKLNMLTVEELQAKLQALNSNKWQQMNRSDQSNPRRLIRAIEIELSPPLADHQEPSATPIQLDPLWLGLTAPRAYLDNLISHRVCERANIEFTQEVRSLRKKYPGFAALPAASATGYREWIKYLDNRCSKAQAIGDWQLRERQYARRQLTWFKKQPMIHWFNVHELGWQSVVEPVINNWYASNNDSVTSR
jgi:tRNA dimethylallyltransferase